MNGQQTDTRSRTAQVTPAPRNHSGVAVGDKQPSNASDGLAVEQVTRMLRAAYPSHPYTADVALIWAGLVRSQDSDVAVAATDAWIRGTPFTADQKDRVRFWPKPAEWLECARMIVRRRALDLPVPMVEPPAGGWAEVGRVEIAKIRAQLAARGHTAGSAR